MFCLSSYLIGTALANKDTAATTAKNGDALTKTSRQNTELWQVSGTICKIGRAQCCSP